jgi:PRTRC genetic system protein E
MFQQLVPLLRQRSVLLTVTLVEDDQVRVNVIPKKLSDGENTALTTPMSFTGSADELDEQLPAAISSFVASHLQLKNTLTRAKEEMDAAAKAAQQEARNKSKNTKKSGAEATKKAEPAAKDGGEKEPEPPRIPNLFDAPAESRAVTLPAVTGVAKVDEEDEILAEISEGEAESSARDEVEEADAAA